MHTKCGPSSFVLTVKIPPGPALFFPCFCLYHTLTFILFPSYHSLWRSQTCYVMYSVCTYSIRKLSPEWTRPVNNVYLLMMNWKVFFFFFSFRLVKQSAKANRIDCISLLKQHYWWGNTVLYFTCISVRMENLEILWGQKTISVNKLYIFYLYFTVKSLF